jgi:hypothetical protein
MLSEKQMVFSQLVGMLLDWIYEQGYGVTFGEAYRTPEQAAFNARAGSGIVNSQHTLRMAVDLNLYINGVYQTETAAYKPLGDYWKSLHPNAAWGGDFSKPDGNHFSLAHNGVR